MDGMSWDEFVDLLAGLNAETPLGRIVSIRTEEDPERLKYFSPSMKKMNIEWRNARKLEEASNVSEEAKKDLYEMMRGLAR